MYAVNLMRLAGRVGLRQVDIGRHLGVVRVQPNIWALGKRSVAEDKVAPLVAFIAKAVKKRLATALPGETIQADLSTLLADCVAENCYRYGHAAEPTLDAFMAEWERYAALSRPQQLEGPKLEHIEKHTASTLFWLKLQADLWPITRLLPEEDISAVEDTAAPGRTVALLKTE